MGPYTRQRAEIAVIIVNWNRREDTLRCLGSLAQVTKPPIDVFVVDNASSDGSTEAIQSSFPDARSIQNSANLGFAEGNNVAIRLALAEVYPFVMLLNNDTTVAPEAIERMLQPMLDDANVGISAPAIMFMNSPRTVWSAGGRIDRKRGLVTSDYYNVPVEALPTSTYQVDHVSGCAMLVRSSAIVQAGVLDPRFFMYYEETEWCARIVKAGYRIVVEPRAIVRHDISPDAQLGSPAIAYYMTRNHLLFLRASHAPLRAWLYTIGWQLRTLASLFLKPTTPARARGRIPMVRAMRDFVLGRFGPAPSPRSR